MTGSEPSSKQFDVDSVECPSCRGTGRCIQCRGEGRIPFEMAAEIGRRVKEREDEIRNEGRKDAERAIEARDQTIESLKKGKTILETKLAETEDNLTKVNEERDRIEDEAKESGRIEGQREREKEIDAKSKKISSLEDKNETLENEIAEFEAKDRKRDSENRKLHETIKKLEESVKVRDTGKTPQEYGLLKEKTLTSFLIHEFPDDSIMQTSASREGDVIQNVNYEGAMVGTILFERKETDHFGKDWVMKLEKDRLRREADYAVLVTKTMNKEDDPVRFKAENILVTKPDKDTVKNFVSHLRQLIIVAKSSIDDSRKQEMKANLERVVESYRRIWTNNMAIARLIAKPLEEIAQASKEGMVGVAEMAKMLKLPPPKPLPELPYKPELLS